MSSPRVFVPCIARLYALSTGTSGAWLKGAAGIGQACIARLDRETVEGVAEGLDGDGALLLRLYDRSLRRISAGDVFFPASGAA